MDLHDLVHALLAGDLLTARQWVADSQRTDVRWQYIDRPVDLNDVEISVAAAVVELFASRAGQTAPAWTTAVGAVRELLARATGPEALLKRNIVALPDFLAVA